MTLAYAWKDIVTTFMNAAGTSATVAEIKTVPAPQFTAEDIDVTNQDSEGVKEFIAGMKEGNEIEFIGNDVPSDTGQQLLLAAADAGESGTFTLAFPSGRSITFTAAIKTFDIIEDNGAGAFSCKVKVSGKPTRGTSPIQLSALTTTAGTLFPTFAAGTYLYTVAALNATSTCTVTPTCATGTITVNGVAVATGVASGNITLEAAGKTTEIGILVTKSGSTATMYKIIVSRSAT
jgi:predicted secreted protein